MPLRVHRLEVEVEIDRQVRGAAEHRRVRSLVVMIDGREDGVGVERDVLDGEGARFRRSPIWCSPLPLDLGADHFQRRAPEQRAKALMRQIERLGFSCAIAPVQPVSI